MADLKIGTTIGGSAIWSKGALPLTPTGNTLTFKTYKIYTEFDKPTPAELNVYAKSETYSQSQVDGLGFIYIRDVRNTNKTPAEYDPHRLTTFFNTSSVPGALPITATWYAGINVKGWSNGYNSWQLAAMSHTGSSDNKLWFRASRSDTVWGEWGRVYSTLDKPTAAEIGAMSTAGVAWNTTAIGVDRLGHKLAMEIGNDGRPYISVDTAYAALTFNPTDRSAAFAGALFVEGTQRVLSAADVNYATLGAWNDIINKVVGIGSNGAIEVGKFIDMHDVNSTADYDVRLSASGIAGNQCLTVSTANGFIDIGAKNTSHAHIYTDRPSFATNKPLYVSQGVHVTTGGSGTIGIHGAGNRILQMEIHDNGVADIAFKNAGGDWKYPINFSENGDVAVNTTSWKKTAGSGSAFYVRNWGNASGNRANVFETADDHGWHFYTQRLTNVSGGQIEFTVNGKILGNQIIDRSSRSFRSIGGRYGTFWHMDSVETFYLMFTNENDHYGSWNSLRPVSFNARTGQALFAHGASSGAGFHMPSDQYVTFNNSNHWASGVGWALGEEGSTGAMRFHRYQSGVWQNSPFEFRNDSTFYCAGNANVNDVYYRSDIRLKKDVVKTENNLATVLKLNPVSYMKKQEMESEEYFHEIGLIAQEVEEIMPDAVATDDKGMKSVRVYALVSALIGAVQEQQKQIEELKAMIK